MVAGKENLGLVLILKYANVNHGGLFRTIPSFYEETILQK